MRRRPAAVRLRIVEPGEHARVEREAEHRRTTDQRAIVGRQRVDARERRGLRRIGQPDHAARLDRRAQEVAQELRIAARALGDDLDHVRGQRPVLRRELGEPQRVALRERMQLDARHVGNSAAT
jgi:hypothetical protein